MVLDRFSPATREWFTGAFPEPTPAQLGAWEAISAGGHALVVAPTGSGKTLAAFLWAIDRLIAEPPPDDPRHRTRVLYISPLKALGVDVERNLRSPLVGVTQTAKRLGLPAPGVTVGVRSGDTTPEDRRLLGRVPPDILITTPESLYLMLTSAARETLMGVETVIVDEVHAVAASKRGAHLAVSLERLDALLPKSAQRIGLSATVRPLEEVARFLGGRAPVQIVAPPAAKTFELRVVVPVDDMTEPGMVGGAFGNAPSGPSEGSAATNTASADATGSIWPHVEEGIVDLILEHRSTIVFANSRRLAERLTARLNEIYEERLTGLVPERLPAAMMAQAGSTKGSKTLRVDAIDSSGVGDRTGRGSVGIFGRTGSVTDPAPAGGTLLARAHHGSVSKEQRATIEDDLKTGKLRCVVATSSLELGIDMGAVDLVVQVESPPSVASGLQRIGRAGHQVGEISKGVLFPKHRADLIHTSVATERMLAGQIEAIRVPANPLDVLAQQTVAAVALEGLDVEEWFDAVRRSAPFATLPRSAYDATLDLLSGLYPSDEFAELRPRIIWDRVAGTIIGRPGAQRLAVTSGGTIPDRGLFGVFMIGGEPGGPGRRVGELDEEMVYESRVGDIFALGTTSWRIEDITHDQVLVSPAFGQPGKVPFWKGDGLGRPAELGEAVGAFTRSLEVKAGKQLPDEVRARLVNIGLDDRAITNLAAFISDQLESTGTLPTDKTLVVERFRDELGDWRIVLHSPYGQPVHAPWALAVGARVRDRMGVEGSTVASDDGIIVRIPDTDAEPPGAELFVFEPAELEQIVTEEVGGSALFAARFRECAARALLMPRYNPGKRSPLWQQRQRASQLLDVARKYPSFPILLETVREVLQDVYDLPALMKLTNDIESRRIRLVESVTDFPSPFARSLLFGYVAAFMYEGDTPLAERRAAALSLDSTLLAELLGRAELRELLDPDVIARTEAELQRLAPDRRARADAEGVVNLLRMLGPLSEEELVARMSPEGWSSSPPEEDVSRPVEAAETKVSIRELRPLLDQLKAANRAIRATIGGAEQWAVVEDASRLRDALGVPLPIGVPTAFVEPVNDPVGDLVGRYARTHGPFTVQDVASRFGLGTAVVLDTLKRLAADKRVVDGEFRPGASGSEWCSVEVLRRLRSRSLAALRQEVEPVPQDALARFLPEWQQVNGTLRGADGLLQVIDQLAGVALPASAWETLVLPARLSNYSQAWLDELTASGEVIWSGAGALPGNDGWVSLHLADTAPLTLADPTGDETTELQRAILSALAGGGAYFFRQLAQAVAAEFATPVDDKEVVDGLWQLVWSGLVTNDTFTPLRAYLGSTAKGTGGRAGPGTRRSATRAYRTRGVRPASTIAAGPPSAGGRWSLLPLAEGTAPDSNVTVRAKAMGELLLERHGVVTRGSVVSEGIRGGFALAYKVLSGFEETGRARRGYFVDGLGAAQFATGATVDRLRGYVIDPEAEPKLEALTLAATDPANAYGAALPWPTIEGHRPGRKAGALVTMVDGRLVLYIERGGKSVLTFTDDATVLQVAASSIASSVRSRLGRMRVEKIDGEFGIGTPLGLALVEAGFAATPQGLRLRG